MKRVLVRYKSDDGNVWPDWLEGDEAEEFINDPIGFKTDDPIIDSWVIPDDLKSASSNECFPGGTLDVLFLLDEVYDSPGMTIGGTYIVPMRDLLATIFEAGYQLALAGKKSPT